MILEQESLNLFPCRMVFCKTDLPHEAIAEFIRDQLSRHPHYTSYYDREYHDKIERSQPFLKEMKQAMADLTGRFYLNMGRGGVDVRQENVTIWYSEYGEGDSHEIHLHPNSTCAGTYWPYSDKNSSEIRFHNPNRQVSQMSDPRVDPSAHEYRRIPRTGEMAAWPPWLEHEVSRQGKVEEPDRTRIAVSWNVRV